MNLPFTQNQLFDVFATANTGTSMISTIIGYIGAFALVGLRSRSPKWTRPVLFGFLAFLWGWIAIGFFWGPFRFLASSARPFGILFLVQAAIFLRLAARRRSPRPIPLPIWRRRLGAALEIYALAVYPILGLWSGHGLADLPWFGIAPCPSTIWTLGVLVGIGECGVEAFIIPLLWCAVGLVAATFLGVAQDWGLGAAACVAIAALIARTREGRCEPHANAGFG